MNVSLTPELEKFVTNKVDTGMYQTASEVIREALRLLRERDEMQNQKLEELRKEIAVGIKDADEGNVSPLDAMDVLTEVRNKRKAKREKKAQ